jgi:hypothetical protein
VKQFVTYGFGGVSISIKEKPVPVGPQKYRGKPVLIDAMRLQASTRADIIAWLGDQWLDREQFDPVNLHIKNEHGVVIAEVGDWIIKGSRGEFYPCKHATFNEKYEVANAKG